VQPPPGRAGDDLVGRDAVRANDLVSAGPRRDGCIFGRAHRGDDVRPGPSRELDRAEADRAGPALDEYHAVSDRPGGAHAAVCGDAEASALLE
jgi:hypothetical protein